MFKYNFNKGSSPKIGDRIRIVKLNQQLDGKTGTVTGWGDVLQFLVIVTLDSELSDGISTISIPCTVAEKI